MNAKLSLIHSKGNLTWISNIGFRVSFGIHQIIMDDLWLGNNFLDMALFFLHPKFCLPVDFDDVKIMKKEWEG